MPSTQSQMLSSLKERLMVGLALNAHQRTHTRTELEQQQEWENFTRQYEIFNKAALLEAIDSDPDKFAQWIKSKPSKNSQLNPQSRWNFDFSNLWSSRAIPSAIAGIMVFSLLLFSLFQQPVSPLQQSYTQVLKIIHQDQQAPTPQPLQNIQGENYSFTGSGENNEHIQAFLSGVEVGRAQLQMQPLYDPKEQTEQFAWQDFGQWYQLNRYVLQNNYQLDRVYWQRQQAILIQLESELKPSPSLAQIHQALNKLQQQPRQQRSSLKLKRGLNDYWIALQVSSNVKQ